MNDIYSLIKVGIVDGINEHEGTIRCTFPDDDEKVSEDVALMNIEQRFPSIGDSVLCVFLPNGTQQGFCLGTYFNDENLPPIPNKNMYVKKLDEGLSITYDYTSKKLTISSQNEVSINSNVSVNGNLTVSGTITN